MFLSSNKNVQIEEDLIILYNGRDSHYRPSDDCDGPPPGWEDGDSGTLPPAFKPDSELKDYARQSLTEKKEVLPPGRTTNLLFFNYNRGPEETADYLPWKSDIFSQTHEDGSPYYTSIGIACYHHFIFPESPSSTYGVTETPKYLQWCFILGTD